MASLGQRLGANKALANKQENRPVVIDEPIRFEKQPVKVESFREIIDPFRGI